ncbi:hypothetical protein BOX15_Mlig002200g1 [Macrostomum lignano]|uniref:Uncharacterized protein n=1 Tax=Macrostomum lignano TaxID=282301 RepID=A0A267GHR5_9PLAT|nr:hypothetical protein BOX15_Mlig002200g1 [Macrostomum lignano]
MANSAILAGNLLAGEFEYATYPHALAGVRAGPRESSWRSHRTEAIPLSGIS